MDLVLGKFPRIIMVRLHVPIFGGFPDGKDGTRLRKRGIISWIVRAKREVAGINSRMRWVGKDRMKILLMHIIILPSFG